MKYISLSLAVSCALLTSYSFAQPGPSGDHDMGRPPSFAELDNNGDGILTQDELQGPMQRDFSQMDSNGDGEVTEPELDSFMRSHKPPQKPQD
ncbi:EF-hand domain-containing protein [Vibrio sp. ABG19]|uniref:EF-hand domain-containing protein n=1 Tax=Vibrio sp. ABG19 TaxID=2817385 RepID=UPI00249F300A|nr:EF-hand domain-containing protein [Vibrio sp. ABG19]WGY44973.1 EF-hand domain-containing protein [Vibrio sp. ABG19]